MRRSRRLMGAALGLAVGAVSADALALDPSAPLSDYAVRVWQTKDGLPAGSVRCIVQTRDGYLWIATSGGLARFDGVKFTWLTKSNTPGLRSIDILWILEDREGALWIATYGGGLSRLKDGEIKTFTTDDGLGSNLVWTLGEDKNGGIWAGMQEGGASLVRDGKITTYGPKEGLPSHTVWNLWVDDEGAVWMGTEGGGVSRFADGKFTNYGAAEGLTSNVVKTIFRDRAGIVWIGTNDGILNRLERGKITHYPLREGAKNNEIWSFREDRAGNVWMGTSEGGLARFEAGRFSSLTIKDGLPNNLVYGITEDREGNLWLGTENGLARLKDAAFVTLDPTPPGQANPMVLSILEDRHGAIWLATQEYGLFRYAGGAWTSYTTKDGLSSNELFGLAEDDDGVLWVGSRHGLNRIENGTIKVLTPRDGLPNDAITSVFFDRAGAFWAGTAGSGLYWRKGGESRVYTTKDGLVSDFVRSFLEDRAGRLWLGTEGGGLSIFHEGKFQNFTTKEGLADDLVYSIYEDSAGGVWLMTPNGISRFRDGKLTTLTTRDGLFSDVVYAILEDAHDNFWMSSSRGVFRVRKADLNARADGKGGPVPFVAYDEEDGMKSHECYVGGPPGGVKTKDGRLWFATTHGVVRVDPEHLPGNTRAPPVRVEKLIVNQKPTRSAEWARLPPDSREFEFQYTAMSFASPAKVSFKYKLEGFDRDWVDVGSRRVAYYTNLAPGAYRFRVIARNNDGIWNDQGDQLAFRIEPHFYDTYGFYGSVVAVIAAAVVVERRRRLVQLKARAVELEGRVNERTAQLANANQELSGALRSLEERDKRLNDDLLKARAFQRRILAAPPSCSALAFAVEYQPAELVGGDLYDVCEIAPGRFRLFLADATGHGVQASLRTMVLKTEYDRVKSTSAGPAELLSKLNDALVVGFPNLELVCTACCVDVTLTEGGRALVHYANAAHPPLLHVAGGAAREIYERGPYLAMIKGLPMAQSEFQMERGDRLFLYTDGLVEQIGENGEPFELERITAALSKPDTKLDALVAALLVEVKTYGRNYRLTDDVTVLGVELIDHECA